MLERIFDRTGSVPRPPYSRVVREAWSFAAYHPTPPDATRLPHGGGHAVLVVPAYMTNDAFSLPLRRFLRQCGFRSYGWELGPNWGPTPRLLAGLRRRLAELRASAGAPVSVIGISLGGLLARDLAHDRPDDIAHLVTLVSPWRLPTASTLEPLVWLCAPFYSSNLDPARLAAPLRMPSTAIYTRDDGLVAWQSCQSGEPGGGDDVEVSGPHVAICRNPAVLRTVVERLAPAGSVRGARATGQ